MKLLTGNSNKSLSQKISKHLKTKLVHSSIRKFADGEIHIEIKENIRGNSIFLIQSTSAPANDNLMELLLCVGLGLSISSDIIRSHGGTIELRKSETGGLEVMISLPV